MKIRFKDNMWIYIGIAIVLIITISPILNLKDPTYVDLSKVFIPPNSEHYFGTDSMGRDVFSRIINGGKTSIVIAVASSLLAITIGVIYGGISGYLGGIVDTIMMRCLEILMSIPSILIIITFQMCIKSKMIGLVIIMGLTGWMSTARIIRSRFMELKEMEFVKIAITMNVPIYKVIINHLLRNSISNIIILYTFTFSSFIVTEASLSFLGIGVPPEIPSWGNMLFNAQNFILNGIWWACFIPGAMILLTTLSVNFIGEKLKSNYVSKSGGY